MGTYFSSLSWAAQAAVALRTAVALVVVAAVEL
jgi:hypothetical protein